MTVARSLTLQQPLGLEKECYFCNRQNLTLNDCLILNHSFPKWPNEFFAHAKCMDDHDPNCMTYGIHLRRIVKIGDPKDPHAIQESLANWTAHLSAKNWVDHYMLTALVDANRLACSIAHEQPHAGASRTNPKRSPKDLWKRGQIRALVTNEGRDYCRSCKDAGEPDHVFEPYVAFAESTGGYRCHYECPRGHIWTCYYSAQQSRPSTQQNPKRERPKRPTISVHTRALVFERDNFTCRRCGVSRSKGAMLHIDHIIPVRLGGKDESRNLQTLCADCNLGKSGRPPHPHDLRQQ